MTGRPLGWVSIFRLGLVQTALGAIVVLTTSTMNRVMVIELALPAMLPGMLVALHYAVQILRPRFGYGSDQGGRRTGWIVGGVGALAIGAIGAAVATAWMSVNPGAGIVLAVFAFILIGGGVGAAGTSLLALLATHVVPERRAAAAMITWMMMIGGIVVTAFAAGHFLDPYSPSRLVVVATMVGGAAFALTLFAVWGVEQGRAASPDAKPPMPPFMQALREVWSDGEARLFTIFVFVSMLAYSAQDLILEPFAGAVFGLTPGQSTQLAGVQHGGVFAGMLLVGVLASGRRSRALASLRNWTIAGCAASALALAALAAGAIAGPGWPLRISVFALGVANGAFAVAAISSMMMLAGAGQQAREGTRIGLWGAAQAIAFGLGGFLGTAALDLARGLLDDAATAYAVVFIAEGLAFLLAAAIAARIGKRSRAADEVPELARGVGLRTVRG
jgi:BCD family chlorophyll transporter-like MFS transporter